MATIIGKNKPGEESTVFPCICCGVCCSKYQARLELTEAQNIADRLGMSFDKFRDDYTDTRWPGKDSYLLRQKDGMCVFLKQETGSEIKHCRIHNFKPAACREWEAGLNKKECREGLSLYWRLSVNSLGEIAGLAKDLARFQSFLKTLN